ncbi:MAG: hypothetical protein KR126chlam2_01273 [Chlamydiae bacterium]|nr:hypothetical protein [Chlamydiota bacterium]
MNHLPFQLKLFVGFSPDSNFEEGMEEANPYLASLLTGGGDYLQKANYNQKRYLGKPTSSLLSVQQLENLEANVVSLLKRLVPGYPFENHPLCLLALPYEDEQ